MEVSYIVNYANFIFFYPDPLVQHDEYHDSAYSEIGLKRNKFRSKGNPCENFNFKL